MSRVTKPSMLPTLNGDLLRRGNLFRFIRDFTETMEMDCGYYMEFGVLNGECMIEAYRQFRGVFSHYYGFDSFEGLPDLSPEDQSARALSPRFATGNFKSLPEDQVRGTIQSSCRMQPSELTLVKGYFSDTLPSMDRAMLRTHGVPLCVYIDCDLYSATRDVLDFLTGILVTGTWLLFDDYWFYRGSPNHGEQRAVGEWLKTNGRFGLSPYCNFNGYGRAFLAYELDESVR